MAGVAIEDALELWAVSLREVKRRIRPLFTQERVAVSAGRFLDGMLGPERRKAGWMRAEAAGDPGPWRQQDRPRPLPAEGLDRRSGPLGVGACAARGRRHPQAAAGWAHGRARDRGWGAVRLG